MNTLIRFPLLVFAFSFLAVWMASWIGIVLHNKYAEREQEDESQDLKVIVGSTLTLLGLIIGFSFSMAIARYDQRKACEEAEANAIGTEFLRASLLPTADATRVRSLLKDYLDQRVSFYVTRDRRDLQQIDTTTAQLQAKLWSAVQASALPSPTPLMSLVVSGMNDVLNSQGYTQAAWWNRIPVAAWLLMIVIAICSSVLVGYSSHRTRIGGFQFLILPFVLSIAFFLIGDIDSPRRGIIRVHPQNLMALVQSLKPQ